MPDVQEVFRMATQKVRPDPGAVERQRRKQRGKLVRERVAVYALAAGLVAAGVVVGISTLRSSDEPTGDPRSLGVFEPVAGRIVYVNEGTDARGHVDVAVGIDRGYDPGPWAVDPSGPSDTKEGPSVADDVASTLVPLDLEEAPRGWSNDATELQFLGWSSDGTELLFTRWNERSFEEYYYILHADGSETRLNKDPMSNAHAAISPDGSRVVFVTEGLSVVDAEGGRPVRLPVPVSPADGDPVGAPTFSPDGTQIAYLANDGVWVVNADGSDAHEILANEATRNAAAWFSGMQWSPAGDRIAIGLGGDPAIYTFAPDGSDFTKVITGGVSPYWSPDGSQIAYTIPCDEYPNASCPEGSPRRSLFDPQPGESPAGLAIADADGSNVRAFGFAASGPWHPVPADENVTPASPSEPAASFPTAAFADISEDPVSEEMAAEFQAALSDMAGGGGMAATVMTADGTWSGAAGKADGVRDVRVDDQFAIASVTKSLVAAQVMQMVEAGELDLDDPAADHLPPDLDFDTNGATIRQLLGHRSGIPDYNPALFNPVLQESPSTDRQRIWTPAEMLELVTADRAPAGDAFQYANTNYLLLGLVIEQIRGRPLAEVLRDGVLSGDGLERLIYQPDEVPTEPMAMPEGESTAALEEGGGYLPSLAGATSDGPAAAMASDSPSLACWWRAFCAGEIVSQASLTEMTTFHDGYGLGLYSPYAGAVGHTGQGIGYVAWAGCLPEDGSVIVVLSNRVVEDIGAMAGPLVIAAERELRLKADASPFDGGSASASVRVTADRMDPVTRRLEIRVGRYDQDTGAAEFDVTV